MGLNLPVKNVVLDGKRWQYLKWYGRWSLEDVSKSEYENMSGRAGRLAHTKDFGRSILVTSSPFEADVWLRHYVGSDFEDIVPTLKEAPLENHVVNLLASGLAERRDDLAELLLSSFTGHVHWNQQMSRDAFLEALDRALSICVVGGLVRRDKDGDLAVTDLGRACASKGLGVDTGIALAEWARDARSVALTDLEVLAVVSLSPAGHDVYVNMTNNERHQYDYRGEILRRAYEAGANDRPVFARLAEDQSSVEYEPAKALKKALFLADWIDERRTKDIERQYHVWAGALRRVGEEYAWLAEALAAIAQACGWPEPRCREIELLSDRLVHGVREDAVSVAKLRVRGLGRVLVRRLVAAGFNTPEAMRVAGEDAVRRAVNHRGAFAALWAKLAGDEQPAIAPARYPMPEIPVLRVAEPIGTYGASEPPPEPPAAQLIVDLRERRVSYRGRAIPTRPPNNLQRQPLLALAVLAERAGEVLTMAEVAEGMFKLGSLRRRLVAPDAKDLRYKLQRPFKRALAGTDLEAEVAYLFETMPGLGLRLNLGGPAQVIASR